jgi:hypothetical protein
VRVVLLVALVGCGRVGFDDERVASDAANEPALADGETCTRARPLTIGVARGNESIDSAVNDYADSQCGGGADVVYAFQQPTAARRRITLSADFEGAFWFSTECPPTPTSCIGFGANSSGLQIESDFRGGTVYVIVEKRQGSGTTFSIAVD